ncbi:MAG: hypothetical protein A3G34_09800 [Candidatus Lindowbacteria bacterium RIFCSPLOWO2_12_FULL_62_27]|nr:MAG: hypothetical protein A3G34_09800 [Candidatus Lindowbacteria bacterium RIFCSPLOWO2_12_FULL_62_27]
MRLVFVILLAAVAVVIAVACMWGPRWAIEYLNRPDTDLRRKISETLSGALGEPVRLAFTVSDARLTPAFKIEIELSPVEISSPTFDRLGGRIDAAFFEIPLIECILHRTARVDRVRVHAPFLRISPEPNGSWPFQTRPGSVHDNTPPKTAVAPSNRPPPGLPEMELRIDSAMVRFRAPPENSDWHHLQHINVQILPAQKPGVFLLDGRIRSINGYPAGLAFRAGPDLARPGAWKGHIEAEQIVLKENVRLSGNADIQVDLHNVSDNLKTMSGSVSLSGTSVRVIGLPTFSALAHTLNDIADALGKILEGRWIASLSDLLDRVTRSKQTLVTEQGTTAFDRVVAEARIADGRAQIDRARFENAEMDISAEGSVGLEKGEMDLTTRITFRAPALQKVESRLARAALARGFVLHIRGTLDRPVFDKESVLKPFLREAKEKILNGKVGDFLFKKLGVRRSGNDVQQ